MDGWRPGRWRRDQVWVDVLPRISGQPDRGVLRSGSLRRQGRTGGRLWARHRSHRPSPARNAIDGRDGLSFMDSWVCSRCESAAGRAWPGRPRLQRRCLSRFPTLGRSATRRCSARRFGREAISVSTLRSATTKKPSVHRTPARSFWIASPRSRRFSIPPPSPT